MRVLCWVCVVSGCVSGKWVCVCLWWVCVWLVWVWLVCVVSVCGECVWWVCVVVSLCCECVWWVCLMSVCGKCVWSYSKGGDGGVGVDGCGESMGQTRREGTKFKRKDTKIWNETLLVSRNNSKHFFRIFVFFSVSRNNRNSAKQWPVSYSFVFRKTKKKYETVNPTHDLVCLILAELIHFGWGQFSMDEEARLLDENHLRKEKPLLERYV